MGWRRAALVALVAIASSGCGPAESGAPADETSRSAPTTVHATCTRGTGIEVSSDVVVATSHGVRITVDDQSGHSDTYITWGWHGVLFSGERAKDHPAAQVPAPPGDLLLSCAPGNPEPKDLVTVQVVDPDHRWTEPEVAEDAGCRQDGMFHSLPPSTGATKAAALDALASESFRDPTSTYEVHYLRGGYRKASERGGQFVFRRDGRTVATGWAGQRDDGTWSASIDTSCAERLDRPYDPMGSTVRRGPTTPLRGP